MTLPALAFALLAASAAPQERGAAESGIYPDLFAELLGRSGEETRRKLDTAFDQLFFGDSASERIYSPVGSDMGYIEDIGNGDIRTEGMSYGMMIALQMDRQDLFDRLWKWAKTHMQFRAGAHRGYFAWHCRPDGTVLDSTAASDGEEWFVTSLLFASARWGEGEGIRAYGAEARAILRTMLHKETEPSHATVTNMFDARTRLVAFVPKLGGNSFTDPSYHLPHFYELWSRSGGADSMFWREAAGASRTFLRRAAHPRTGLFPDYAEFDGAPVSHAGRGHADFRFDAWRVAMNVAVDWLWFRRDAWEVAQSDRLLAFFRSRGISQYGNQYTLEGKALSSDHSPGLVAANAVAALAATGPGRSEFVSALWNTPVPRGRYRYYDGMLYLLGMLQVSGNFRVYEGGGPSFLAFDPPGFPLASSGKPAPLYLSAREFPGVLRMARAFQGDIGKITGRPPVIAIDTLPPAADIVIVGTLGKNPLIDTLAARGRISLAGLAGAWDSYMIQEVRAPLPGVARALLVVGSNKRGTMYGMFTISRNAGVSPWYWWADVPAAHHSELYVRPGRHLEGPPAVKYRGIFLNDEKPDLTSWVRATYGDLPPRAHPPVPSGIARFGHEFYERVFELLLRLKANYLWPAMWDNAFNEDDPENARLADEYGIVMGTSHQEPMLRAQKEWDRRYKQTLGSWNYAKYPDTLASFWREGIRRNRSYESIITIGLRGADDTPMAPGGPASNRALLEEIVGLQRRMLGEEMDPDVTRIPQLWCPYKEALEYYDSGMRVPDDVTLLWPDDNWGNLRRLPTADERRQRGGAGVYYHFDYHGGPRSYQWINTNPLPKIWDQMALAREYGADRIWIVNVGHLKGYELPTEYFLDLAWKDLPGGGEGTREYTERWAEREFGGAHARAIAGVVARYTMYNGRCKPELLSPTTYSMVNYHEAETVVRDFNGIADSAAAIYNALPPERRDAFYELVYFPVRASALVNELYVTAGKNALYARQRRASTNDMATETRALFSADTALMGYFNRTLAGGRWNHFMDQPHLGYTSWRDPPENSLRAIVLDTIRVPGGASMGVTVEGTEDAWPGTDGEPLLPPFNRFRAERRSIEIFNRGSAPFRYTATSDRPWIQLSSSGGEITKDTRLWVAIDWGRKRAGDGSGTVTIKGAGEAVRVGIRLADPPGISPASLRGFIETGGAASIEAEHWTDSTAGGGARWTRIDGYGHTLSGMRASAPPGAPPLTPGHDSPSLAYRIYFADTGNVGVAAMFGAALNFIPGRSVRYAVSIDAEQPRVVTLVGADYRAGDGNRDWERAVEKNGRTGHTAHRIGNAGYHVLRIWMVDPGVVLEKIVLDLGGVRPSTLGPPESYHRNLRGGV